VKKLRTRTEQFLTLLKRDQFAMISIVSFASETPITWVPMYVLRLGQVCFQYLASCPFCQFCGIGFFGLGGEWSICVSPENDALLGIPNYSPALALPDVAIGDRYHFVEAYFSKHTAKR
jgi:hypothetical protein